MVYRCALGSQWNAIHREGVAGRHERSLAWRESVRPQRHHRVLRPARDAAGIEYGGWHRLRHTAATRLIESGARPDQAQRWLGHHDSAFTVRVYVHPQADDLPDPDEVWGEPGAVIPAGEKVQYRTEEAVS